MGLIIEGKLPDPKKTPQLPAQEKKTKPKKAEEPQLASSGTAAQITDAIHKSKGAHVVVMGNKVPPVPRLRTGIFEFDLYTGGGFPKGRYTILYGPESSGKTNTAYCAVAEAQRGPESCNKAVWFNIEPHFDPIWAAKFGIDTSKLILVQPGYGEEAADLIDAFMRAEDVAIVVVDSISGLISNKEINQSMEKFDMGSSSLLIKRLVNKMQYAFSAEAAKNHLPCVILINQTRFKLGVMFGDPETMPGGEAQKFLASLRVRLYGKNEIPKGTNPNLHSVKSIHAVIKKSKVPVLNSSFDYDHVMIPHNGLEVGQTNSWPTVKDHLQQLGHLVKVSKGYELAGMLFPTLGDIQDQYILDHDFRMELQGVVIESYKDSMKIVEEAPEPGAAKPQQGGIEIPVEVKE